MNNVIDITPDYIAARIEEMLEGLLLVAHVDEALNPNAERDWPSVAQEFVLGRLAEDGLVVGPQEPPTVWPSNVIPFRRGVA